MKACENFSTVPVHEVGCVMRKQRWFQGFWWIRGIVGSDNGYVRGSNVPLVHIMAPKCYKFLKKRKKEKKTPQYHVNVFQTLMLRSTSWAWVVSGPSFPCSPHVCEGFLHVLMLLGKYVCLCCFQISSAPWDLCPRVTRWHSLHIYSLSYSVVVMLRKSHSFRFTPLWRTCRIVLSNYPNLAAILILFVLA